MPWQALIIQTHKLERNRRRTCGGSLISNQWILTAAHCHSPEFEVDAIYLGLNSQRLRKNSVHRNAARIINYPQYNHRSLRNDIALIELDKPVQYNAMIQPICLSDGIGDLTQVYGFVAGWGYTDLG